MFWGKSPILPFIVNSTRRSSRRLFIRGFPKAAFASGANVRILLSNDDGIHSPCLRALHDALREAGHEIDVVAPLTEQSGVSCAVTLHSPLRAVAVREQDFCGTAIAGTPVDCVKLALTTLLERRPDLVVVGINNGSNKGIDVFYSGTVGAATEAALCGLPAVAFSRPRPELEPPQGLARHAAGLVDAVDWTRFAGKVLNVNYPRCRVQDIRGIRSARMATTRWDETYERREDPAGRPYWWIADFLTRERGGDDTDIAFMEDNWVSVTPIQIDRTDRESLDWLRQRFQEFQSGGK